MAEYKGVPSEESAVVSNFETVCADNEPHQSRSKRNVFTVGNTPTQIESTVQFRNATNKKFTFPGARGNLYYAVLAANLGAMAMGPQYSWPSPTLPRLQANDSWLPLTVEQGSWIVSLEMIGTMVGPFVAGCLVNRVGRRWTIFTGVIFGLVSWCMLLVSSAVWHLYLARFIGGVGGGIEFLSCPMYTAEIAEPAVRGALGSIFAFFLVGGYQFGYIIGPYVSYSWLILASLVPTFLFFLLFPLVPESPYYCLRKGQTTKALKSLSWLRTRRDVAEVQTELDEIQREVRKSLEEPPKISDLVATRGTRMALMLSLGVVMAQPLTGIDVILSYAEQIFIMAGFGDQSKVFTIIIGVVLFISQGLSSPLARMFGIKNILITSGFGSSAFMTLLGVYFYLQTTRQDVSTLSWLPVFSLGCYIVFFSIGSGPLAWAVVAEVFPSRVKPLASAICTFANKFLAFFLTKFFIQASDAFGTHIVAFFFSLCCFLAAIFVLFLLPDTRGMTLPQILARLEGEDTEKKGEADPLKALQDDVGVTSQAHF